MKLFYWFVSFVSSSKFTSHCMYYKNITVLSLCNFIYVDEILFESPPPPTKFKKKYYCSTISYDIDKEK